MGVEITLDKEIAHSYRGEIPDILEYFVYRRSRCHKNMRNVVERHQNYCKILYLISVKNL